MVPFAASNLYQRTLVYAHGCHWIVCLVLDKDSSEPIDGDRFALAVPCNEEGHLDLPATPQLIRFTPPEVVEKRKKRETCAAADHPLRDRWLMFGGKMTRSCDCGDKREEREPTAAERAQRL
jgi:hypothetical protein